MAAFSDGSINVVHSSTCYSDTLWNTPKDSKLFCWIAVYHYVAFSAVQHGLDNFHKVGSKVEEFQTFIDEFMIYRIEGFGEIDEENHSWFLVEVADGNDFEDIEDNFAYVVCVLISLLTSGY